MASPKSKICRGGLKNHIAIPDRLIGGYCDLFSTSLSTNQCQANYFLCKIPGRELRAVESAIHAAADGGAAARLADMRVPTYGAELCKATVLPQK